MDLFVSENGQQIWQAGFNDVPLLLTSVVYRGERKDAAPIIWSVQVRLISDFGTASGLVSVGLGPLPAGVAGVSLLFRTDPNPGVVGIGGCLIGDVEDGTRINLFASTNAVGFIALVERGFSVRV